MRKLFGISLYLVGVLAFLEVGSRIVLSLDPVEERVRGRSDAAWRLDWVGRHGDVRHGGGVEIYYPFDVFHPTRGWAVRPGLDGADVFGPGSVSSNSVGLRGRREVALEKEPGRTRILLLGDSFTFGDEVADADTWAERLQALLPQAEVLNFGVHGYGHDQMLLYLAEDGVRYRPDVVVLGFVRDDMERNLLAFRDYAKPRFELAGVGTGGRGLELANVPVPQPEELLAREPFRSRFVDLLAMVREAWLWKTGARQQEMEALTRALLDGVVERAVEAGAVTVFAYLPHSEELAFPDLEHSGQTFFHDYCASRAAFCLDLRPRFLEAMAGGLPVKNPGHWHANGHRLVAEGVQSYLLDRQLVRSS